MALRHNAEFCIEPHFDCEVDLVAADEATSIGEEEDEDAFLVG